MVLEFPCHKECVSLVNIHELSIEEIKERLQLRKDDVESFKDYGYGEDLKSFFLIFS